MTQAQNKARLRRIIKTWKKRLALQHVSLELAWDEPPEDPDALASIYVSEYYDLATMRFADGWEEFDDFELNRLVVHELLHILFHEYGVAARSITVAGGISTDVRLMWHDRCNTAEERVVDRLAHRLVELGGVVT